MTRDEARQEIRDRVSCKDYLTKSKSGLYCCPFCQSGTGKKKTGALKLYDTNTWTCHACGKSGDIFDLYQKHTGADFNTALFFLADQLGITIDEHRTDGPAAPQNHETEPAEKNTPDDANGPDQDAGRADYREYYKACRERLTDPAAVKYLQGRGISIETAESYFIGFDPAADPASAPGAMGNEYKPHPCPRLIIPTSRGHYVGRRIDGKTDFDKVNAKNSTPGIFNELALYAQDVQEIFVVEGVFDALSILEAGRAAVALNSTSNADRFIKQMEKRRTAATLILCQDNDEAGQRATEKLREGLQTLEIPFIVADISGSEKDANAALQKDRAAFFEAVEVARRAAQKPDNVEYYINRLMTADMEKFSHERKTGFDNLDRLINGLYDGLYIMAAPPSLGKTTFMLQLCDQLAAGGNDVIFFSLEMSKLELVSKSIARRTAQDSPTNAVTSLNIRRGYLPDQVKQAAKEYKETVSDRVSIVEGNFNCNSVFIGDYVRQYIKRNNTRPIVIIDYLQILQPATDRRQSVKESVDNTITELKRLSRELELTIIAVSSINRANYMQPIDFESLKESGGIEFTADVVWGLQLQCLNEDLFSQDKKIKEKRERIKEAKAETPRKIELVCLKNRYGISSYSCVFKYYPANDLFEEDNGAEIRDFKTTGRRGAVRI